MIPTCLSDNTMFSWNTLALLVPINHCLSATAFLSIVADHVHSCMAATDPSSNVYFQHDNVIKQETSQTGSMNIGALSQKENLLDVIHQEIWCIKVQLKNLHAAIISTRTRISKQRCQHRVRSMHKEMNVKSAKQGPSLYLV